MFENKQLFNAQDSSNKGSNLHHIADIIAMLGLPPLEYFQCTKTSWKYFNNTGNWIGAVDILDVSLESSEEQFDNGDKNLFLDFIRKMLQWVPARRQTANQLLHHPWLRKTPQFG